MHVSLLSKTNCTVWKAEGGHEEGKIYCIGMLVMPATHKKLCRKACQFVYVIMIHQIPTDQTYCTYQTNGKRVEKNTNALFTATPQMLHYIH